VPRVVCKQVPVEVCAPAPACCASGCGEAACCAPASEGPIRSMLKHLFHGCGKRDGGCGCEAAPACGCEAPACGCAAEPTCGCEPSCGC
jgi:hypothetical protein